jgi:U3 small nucleolar RNA-associated protein 20
MVAVIGNTLYSDNGQVLVQGLKAVAAIAKCPLKAKEKSMPVFVRQVLDIVQQAGNTESEVAQAALKALATIIRDSHNVHVKERDLVQLIEILSPDLEEPARQAAVFTMLRAIVSRKFVVPEIYDMMDKVSEIMVTSQSLQVQELCRGVLLQFLLDYPQGKNRLRNQMSFLAKNLSYVYESGRKSTMELLSAVISKFETGLVMEYADLIFVALVMVLANDDSAKCREMAATLIQSLITRLDQERRATLTTHLHAWSTQNSQPRLAGVAAQVYGLIIDVIQQEAAPHISMIFDDLNALVQANLVSTNVEGEIMVVDNEWQTPYQALVTLGKLVRVFPDMVTDDHGIEWSAVVDYLLYPHAWVRLAACRLLGQLFASVPVVSPRKDLPDNSAFSAVGMQRIAMDLCTQLKSTHLDAALSLQIVKNLFYIGKSFSEIPLSGDVGTEAGATSDEESEEEENHNDNLAQHPLPWLFSRLSYQLKSAHIARRNRSTSNVSLTVPRL